MLWVVVASLSAACEIPAFPPEPLERVPVSSPRRPACAWGATAGGVVWDAFGRRSPLETAARL